MIDTIVFNYHDYKKNRKLVEKPVKIQLRYISGSCGTVLVKLRIMSSKID
jgi:hypothetical protein